MPIGREFVDERFERAYVVFGRLTAAFSMLCTLAFAIAVMGLVAMVLFVVARRQHEMAVRKVLGARRALRTREPGGRAPLRVAALRSRRPTRPVADETPSFGKPPPHGAFAPSCGAPLGIV